MCVCVSESVCDVCDSLSLGIEPRNILQGDTVVLNNTS